MRTENALSPIETPLSQLDARYTGAVVPTPDGAFAVGSWAGSSAPVLALHGISSNHLLWSWAAAADPELHIVAPDLRGRGGSIRQGPFGLLRHRDDMLALLDVLGLDRVVLAGMSMGGFVATAMAAAAPDRFDAVLLVDGGLPFVLDDQAAAVGSVNERAAAASTFSSLAEYTDTYLSALGQGLERNDPLLSAFLGWNLEETADGLAVRLPGEAIAQDARDTFGAAPTAQWLESLQMPVHLMHVENSPIPIDAAGWASRLPAMTEQRVEGVDHATIVIGESGGALVMRALRELVERSSAGE